MSDRKLAKAVQSLIRQVARLSRNLSRALIAWLLRAALVANRHTRPAAGFVLPTTVLLILVVSLTAGALSYRAFNTSTRTINETQNRVIYNAATPAIDRARAKIEFLFDATKDTRYPGGVPSSDFLTSMLLNDGTTFIGKTTTTPGQKAGRLIGADPYTLPDELKWGTANGFASGRLDSNSDGTPDNAWGFRADTDGDGTPDATIVYSIALSIPADTSTTKGWQRLVALSDANKAKGLASPDPQSPVPYARTGPLGNSSSGGCGGSGSSTVESGWYPDKSNTAVLRRNFQVDAFVLPDSAIKPGSSANFATLEFQQDRVLNRGNKWGAWFRNDLEIAPGPPFQWNGAMHTEGSLIIGEPSTAKAFSAYLISSPASCLWYESASEITVTDVTSTGVGTPDFQGQVVSGKMRDNTYGGDSLIHIWSQAFNPGNANAIALLGQNTDSVTSGDPFNVSIDPKTIQKTNGYVASGGTSNRGYRDTAYDTSTLKKRIFNRTESAPYVDDTYRADDRYGPKQKYSDQVQMPVGKKIGDLIDGTDNVSTSATTNLPADPALTAQDDPLAKPGDTPNLGLDGYWERRARFQGLRVLVGQRLELGNPFGWVAPQDRPLTRAQDLALTTITAGNGNVTDLRTSADPITRAYATVPLPVDMSAIDPDTSDNEGDPLYAPHSTTITHEARQRRALRDNLSAVQSTAVYHAAVDKDYPVACMASVVHPGSPLTLQQSLNFVPTAFVDSTAASNPENNAAPSTIDTALIADFFNGRGTDGWEFDSPGGNKQDFLRDIDVSSSPLRIALQNLAQFAGDHKDDTHTGAFPPTQENGQIHPDPEFAMWGNFSNLRRTLAQLNSGMTYTNLSIADKTYLHTAACTLGMLAYNIDRVQRFDPTNFKNDIVRPGQGSSIVTTLVGDLYKLMDGTVSEGNNNFEVLPIGRLATYGYDPTGGTGYDPTKYNARDYDRVPAEAYLGKLREFIAAQNPSINPNNDPRYRLAELIFTYFQIRRDRTFGFRPSPAANTWNYNPYVAQISGQVNLWSSACDPNVFAINDTSGKKTGKLGVVAYSSPIAAGSPFTNFDTDPTVSITRLTLSRLCGTVIPPGAVHDYPGDNWFPSRNGNAAIASLKFIPSPSPASVQVTGTTAAFSATGTGTLNNAPYIANATNNDNGYPYLAASVAPKWPSLYYLFPEVTHTHKGTVTDVGSFSSVGGNPAGPDHIGTDNLKDNLGNASKNWEDDVDHRQPDGALNIPSDAGGGVGTVPLAAAFQPWAEPYITDTYINSVNTSSVTYNPVDTLTPAFIPTGRDIDTGYVVSNISFKDPKTNNTLTYDYKTFGNPLPDRPVSALVLKPRKLPTGFNNPLAITNNATWQLPVSLLSSVTVAPQNTPPNRITAPDDVKVTGVTAVIPFLDRALFNGREWMPARVTDFDLGMLRRKKVSDTVTILPVTDATDVWLPVSGIVYAFREDAVREDAINRPSAGTYTDARNPSSLTDPPITSGTNISVKQVDFVADPDRRPHGFRLRNGSQLKRHAITGVTPQKNIRGLSFFTDNPLYIMGFYNLHQKGSADATQEDVGDPTDATYQKDNFLEEFKEKLPQNGSYSPAQFYTDRVSRDNTFADQDGDRWRPSEILADAITVLSNSFCDGSVLDTFMTTGDGSGAKLSGTGIASTYDGRKTTDSGFAFPVGFYPYRNGGASVYTTANSALYGPGCTDGGSTSFLNQNRPKNDLPSSAWAWLRENPYDIFSPIKISRNGAGMTIQSQVISQATLPLQGKPLVPIPYATVAPINGAYFVATDDRPLQIPQDTRVNTILVSGIIPSRAGQSYGGLHNFPRFLEKWDAPKFLWFAGSFLQLNFSNYATANFDQDVWEPGVPPLTNLERIPYYGAPPRLWGYDVALQKSPAGPAASRFVTATKDRNEFYQEPAANDPYIRNLCIALPDALFPDAKCPS